MSDLGVYYEGMRILLSEQDFFDGTSAFRTKAGLKNVRDTGVQRIDHGAVKLQHRLATGDDHQPVLLAFSPNLQDSIGKRIRIGELPAALAIGADKIRVAEIALRSRPVLLASGPEIASGKTQERGAPAALHPLALQREEAFLDGVGHA